MGQLYFSKNDHASARTGKTQAIQADCRDRGSREDADVAPLGLGGRGLRGGAAAAAAAASCEFRAGAGPVG